MRGLNLIQLTGLILLGAITLVVLVPVIAISLQVILLTSFLMLAGLIGAKLGSGLRHLRAWAEGHHWAIHRHSGPGLRIG
jgi:hypothetical protein